jgi:hypothetical protein
VYSANPRKKVPLGSMEVMPKGTMRLNRSGYFFLFSTFALYHWIPWVTLASASWVCFKAVWRYPPCSLLQITKKYRESCPDGRIVAITNATLANSAVEADALVYGLEGPDALLAAISGSHDPLGNRKPIQQRRLQSKKPGAYSKGS